MEHSVLVDFFIISISFILVVSSFEFEQMHC
jgi:hypothetical protein